MIYLPTLHELIAGILSNILTQPVQWLICALLALILRDRKIHQTSAEPAAGGTPVSVEQRPLGIVLLDVVISVSLLALFAPLIVAAVFAAGTISLALAIAVVVLAIAFFVWVVRSLYRLFTAAPPEQHAPKAPPATEDSLPATKE